MCLGVGVGEQVDKIVITESKFDEPCLFWYISPLMSYMLVFLPRMLWEVSKGGFAIRLVNEVNLLCANTTKL